MVVGFTYRGLSPHKFTPMPGVHNGIKVDGKKPPRLISGVEAYRIITRIYLRGRYAPAFFGEKRLYVNSYENAISLNLF
jgi:hypothetical protein